MTTKKSSVWETLSAIDVSKHIERKGQFDYLPWSWCWSILMKHYPTAEFGFDTVSWYGPADMKTAEVWCWVEIDDMKHFMFLPVMDYKMNAKLNPNARDISDTRMRCLVKCVAMFGLGLNLWLGEMPEQDPVRHTTEPETVTPAQQIATIEGQLLALDENTVDAFLKYYDVTRPADIPHFKLAKCIDQLTIKLKEGEAVA